MTTRLQ